MYRLQSKSALTAVIASVFAATLLVCNRGGYAADPIPGDDAISLDAGTAGIFNLQYPELLDQSGKSIHKPIEKHHTDATADVKYDGGAEIAIAVKSHGEVEFTITDLPDDVKSMLFTCLINMSYSQGGTYQIEDGASKPFPAEKPANAHLFQTHSTLLVLKNSDGVAVSFKYPPFTYMDIQDNREWNWSTFASHAFVPVSKDHPTYTIVMSTGEQSAAGGHGAHATAKIDQFGQSIAADFPEKVKTTEQLLADVASEDAYYGSLTPPTMDMFGGWPSSGAALGLKQTGYFHCETHNGKWYLIDPAGNQFFALGVCAYLPADDYTYIGGRKDSYQWIPPTDGEMSTAYKADQTDVVSFHLANQIQKYKQPYDPEEYATRMLSRLRKWGFNTVGPFAETTEALKTASFPYVRTLPLSPWGARPLKQIPGIMGVWDPFDENNRAALAANFAEKLPPRAEDPLLIGYFLANEPLFEDIPRVVPQLDGSHACKKQLVDMLQSKYGEISSFNTAWNMSADSFDALIDTGLPIHTAAAASDVHAFTNLFLETYYKLIFDTFKKYDNNHMLIGDRLQSGTINNESLIKIASKYLDIVSFNYYTYGIDKDFLTRIHQWSNKPIILSEYFYDSPHDSGLIGGGKDVSSQEERGLAYRNYVEQSASLGFVVGSEWFTLVDQSATGRWFQRYNGEDGNTGLLSVADRPWKKMLAPMMVTNYTIYDLLAAKREPFALKDGRFALSGALKKQLNIAHSASTVKLDGTAAGFPGTPAEQISASRLVNGSDPGGVEASFKLCWDKANLYALFDVTDPTPMKNVHTGNLIWAGDCVELFIGSDQLDKGGPVIFSDRHLLISGALIGGKPQWYSANAESQPRCKVTVIPNVNGKGYVIEAAIPFSALGFTPTVGRAILFDVGVNDSTDGQKRSRQFMWNGTDRNSGDRTHWGRAVLGQ